MRVTRRAQGGLFLLEALVALVVFSLAMLALAGALGHALRESGSTRWRSPRALGNRQAAASTR